MRLLLFPGLFALLPLFPWSQKPVTVADPAFDYSTAFPSPSPLPKEFAGITYQTEVVEYGADGKHVKVIRATPNYALAACGGVLLGRDAGEWGGELVFRRSDRRIQWILQKNVHGIFQMPFGIVAFTGLAHLSVNQGSIYVLSCGPAGIASVKILLKLPGEPSDVFRTTQNDLVFRVMTNNYEKQGPTLVPVKDCYLLKQSGELESLRCLSVVKATRKPNI